jgi:DNA-binding PadR family transcriptional regulator
MNVDQFLPLRPVEFQVLASLSQGDRHGYAILQEIEERGEGGAVPGLATLYRAIVRLEKETLICRTENGAAAVDDERRRVYGITPLGKAVVEAEARRLAPMVDLVKGATT